MYDNNFKASINISVEPWLDTFIDAMKDTMVKSLEAGMPSEASDLLMVALKDVARYAIVSKRVIGRTVYE